MLYSFLTSFIDSFSFLNVFKYLTFRTGLSLMTSLIIVFVFLFCGYLGSNYLFKKRENWVLFVSSAIFGISLMLTLNAKFW